jgi:3-mercaptopyruvate sulfurtransferase SseA
MRYLLFLTFAAAFIAVIACAKPAADASNTTVAANSLAPQPALTPTPVPSEEVPRISLADAKKAFDEGNAYIVDARAESVYKDEHIKGAVNITSGTLDHHLKELPTNKKIIVYCS